MFRLIIFLIHTGANNKSCSIVALSGFSANSLDICFSSSAVMFFSPIQRRACTRSRIKTPLKAKFLGAPCFSTIKLFPIESFLLEPVVRKLVVIGTCVEKPNWLAAVTPVGIITAMSRLAISDANSKAEGYSMPKRVLRALTYTPFDIREIMPSFSNIASSLVTYSTSYCGKDDTKNTSPNLQCAILLWNLYVKHEY